MAEEIIYTEEMEAFEAYCSACEREELASIAEEFPEE